MTPRKNLTISIPVLKSSTSSEGFFFRLLNTVDLQGNKRAMAVTGRRVHQKSYIWTVNLFIISSNIHDQKLYEAMFLSGWITVRQFRLLMEQCICSCSHFFH